MLKYDFMQLFDVFSIQIHLLSFIAWSIFQSMIERFTHFISLLMFLQGEACIHSGTLSCSFKTNFSLDLIITNVKTCCFCQRNKCKLDISNEINQLSAILDIFQCLIAHSNTLIMVNSSYVQVYSMKSQSRIIQELYFFLFIC